MIGGKSSRMDGKMYSLLAARDQAKDGATRNGSEYENVTLLDFETYSNL